MLVPFCRLFRWSVPPSSLASPGIGGFSNPVSWTKEVLQKDEAKTKRSLNTYTVAAALSSQLLPFHSSQAAISVAAMMTRNCY